MLRIGAIDIDLIEVIDKQFKIIDNDKSGFVTNAEVNGLLTFTKFDYDSTGRLDLGEFVALMASPGSAD